MQQMQFPQQPICFGIVLQNQDSEHPGQVKVQMAALYEAGYNEAWAYLAVPYGGEQYGFCFVPEVGEQVLVLFPYGELPVVFASMRGIRAEPPECGENSENGKKVLKTKSGNQIWFQDTDGHSEIRIQTAKGLIADLSDETKTIAISDQDGKNAVTIDGTNGTVTLLAEKKLVLKVGSAAILEADGSGVTLKSGKITIQGDQTLEEKGGQLKLSGQTAELKASGQLTIQSSGITQVKGSMLKLN